MTENTAAAGQIDDGDAHGIVVEQELDPAQQAQNEEDYGEKVRKRIAKERRLRGEVERDLAQERARVADLESRLRQSDQTAIGYADVAVGQRMQALEASIAAAYAVGDAVKLAQLQSEMANVAADARQIAALKARPAAPAAQPQQQFTPATSAWIAKNPWFSNDKEMREAAISIHHKVKTRFTPDTPEYFAEIENRMKGAFPEHFEEDEPPRSRSVAADPADEETEQTQPTRPAGTARTVGGREPASQTRVRLSAEEIDVARSLGMTPERYAKQKLALQKSGQLGKYQR